MAFVFSSAAKQITVVKQIARPSKIHGQQQQALAAPGEQEAEQEGQEEDEQVLEDAPLLHYTEVCDIIDAIRRDEMEQHHDALKKMQQMHPIGNQQQQQTSLLGGDGNEADAITYTIPPPLPPESSLTPYPAPGVIAWADDSSLKLGSLIRRADRYIRVSRKGTLYICDAEGKQVLGTLRLATVTNMAPVMSLFITRHHNNQHHDLSTTMPRDELQQYETLSYEDLHYEKIPNTVVFTTKDKAVALRVELGSDKLLKLFVDAVSPLLRETGGAAATIGSVAEERNKLLFENLKDSDVNDTKKSEETKPAGATSTNEEDSSAQGDDGTSETQDGDEKTQQRLLEDAAVNSDFDSDDDDDDDAGRTTTHDKSTNSLNAAADNDDDDAKQSKRRSNASSKYAPNPFTIHFGEDIHLHAPKFKRTSADAILKNNFQHQEFSSRMHTPLYSKYREKTLYVLTDPVDSYLDALGAKKIAEVKQSHLDDFFATALEWKREDEEAQRLTALREKRIGVNTARRVAAISDARWWEQLAHSGIPPQQVFPSSASPLHNVTTKVNRVSSPTRSARRQPQQQQRGSVNNNNSNNRSPPMNPFASAASSAPFRLLDGK